jgi:hypothetical protein
VCGAYCYEVIPDSQSNILLTWLAYQEAYMIVGTVKKSRVACSKGETFSKLHCLLIANLIRSGGCCHHVINPPSLPLNACLLPERLP